MYPPFGPLLFQLGPLALHWYGLIMVVAILAGAWIASRYVARHGQDSNIIWDMLLWVLIPALIGERLYYVFISSPRGPDGLGHYLANPIEILEIWRGGMHIYGAFIFGGIAIAVYARWRKLPLLIYLDAVAFALPLGQALGRWASFINQEFYGSPTTLPWGLRIDATYRIPPYNNLIDYPESLRFHPLFLYESLANLVGFVLIFWISRRFEKRLRSGDLFLLYLIWYPLVRFCLEFLHTDSWFFPGTPFNVVHLLSAITIVISITLLIIHHRSIPALAALEGVGGKLQVAKNADIDGTRVSTVEAEDVNTVTVVPKKRDVVEEKRVEPIGSEASTVEDADNTDPAMKALRPKTDVAETHGVKASKRDGSQAEI